jgi:hypothetical protein
LIIIVEVVPSPRELLKSETITGLWICFTSKR